ncbi:hypothetical protein ACHAXR_003889, partial [Thalassiosira sp. AJA248-18]
MSTMAAASTNQPDEESSSSSSGETTTTAPLFSSIPTLHPSSLHAIEHKMKLSTMTEIQHKSFEAASGGRDILGRARTGTGKTLAFLLPALENALRQGRVPGPHDGHTGGIAIMILSPTRELAMQIHNQAQILTASHANSSSNNNKQKQEHHRMASQVMYGGSSRGADIQKLEDNTPYILVATPGRLIDHMENSHVHGTPFSELIGHVSVWVLDEADRCLDMGFRNDMEWILGVRKRYQQQQQQLQQGGGAAAAIPRELQERQTLLFSATLPKDLRSIMASHMRPDYLTVDCVHDVDPMSHTNANVDQSYVTLPTTTSSSENKRWIAGLVDILEHIIHIQNPTDFKAVVFFPTTAMCQFFSHVFNDIYNIPVLEIHSKKSQPNRTSTSDKFRKFRKGILFTTDVSARGVDYPNVTHVIQYGSAENRETYIHRLGRTGRAGKKGRGILILAGRDEERQTIKSELKGLDLKLDDCYQNLLEGRIVEEEEGGEATTMAGGGIKGAQKRKQINEARLQKILTKVSDQTNQDGKLQQKAASAYRSLLGYNLAKMSNLGLSHKVQVVEHVNSLALQMGYEEGNWPMMSERVVKNLGLGGIRGINVGNKSGGGGGGGRYGNDDGRGGGRGGGGGQKRGGGRG